MKIAKCVSKKHFTPLWGIQYSGGRIEGNDGALVLMMFAMCIQKDASLWGIKAWTLDQTNKHLWGLNVSQKNIPPLCEVYNIVVGGSKGMMVHWCWWCLQCVCGNIWHGDFCKSPSSSLYPRSNKHMKMTEFFSKKCFTPLLGIQYSGGRIEGNDGALVLMMFAMCMQKDNNKKNLYLSRAR